MISDAVRRLVDLAQDVARVAGVLRAGIERTYPWVAAQGSKVSVSLYNTSAAGRPDTVPNSAQWFASYLESTDGGASFSTMASIDPTPAKTGIVCVGGINCASGRELGDFQTVTIDNAGRANVVYDRVTGANSQVMFVRQS